MRRLPLVTLVLLPLLLSPSGAAAKPMHTPLAKVLAESESIVVAKRAGDFDYKQKKAKLDVLKVVKGRVELGVQEIAFDDGPDAPAGEFIAFLDKNRIWRFIATPRKGDSVEDGVLVLEGFYDFNIHFVTPSLVTLRQLQEFAQKGTLVHRFRGRLVFPQQGAEEWQPGDIMLQGSLDVTAERSEVQFMPEQKGLGRPEVTIRSVAAGQIELRFPLLFERRLSLIGDLERIDEKTGEYVMRFGVSAPDILTEKGLRQYLANPRFGPPSYAFRLKGVPSKLHAGPPNLTLILGQGENGLGLIEGWENTPLDVEATMRRGDSFSTSSSFSDIGRFVAPELKAMDGRLHMIAFMSRGDLLVLSFDLGPKNDPSDRIERTLWSRHALRLFTQMPRGTVAVQDSDGLHLHHHFVLEFDREIPAK